MQGRRWAIGALAAAALASPAAEAETCAEIALTRTTTHADLPGIMFTVINKGPSPVVLVTDTNEIVAELKPDSRPNLFVGDSGFRYRVALEARGGKATVEVCQ